MSHVRWVASRQRVCWLFLKNISQLVMILNAYGNGELDCKSETKEKAKGICNRMFDSKFIFYLTLFADLTSRMASFSVTLRADDFVVANFKLHYEAFVAELKAMRDSTDLCGDDVETNSPILKI